MVAISEGHAIAPGVWALPLAALPNLKLIIPPGLRGRSELVITLITVDGDVLAEARSSLIVADPPDRADAASTASMLSAGTPPAPKPVARRNAATPNQASPPEDQERARRLLTKGDLELHNGNVAEARLYYRRAADAGLAQAAMALAATYDAAELTKMRVRGVAPDQTEAARWYERAHQLGAEGAEQRLQRLGVAK
jgi:hypothetical protein